MSSRRGHRRRFNPANEMKRISISKNMKTNRNNVKRNGFDKPLPSNKNIIPRCPEGRHVCQDKKNQLLCCPNNS